MAATDRQNSSKIYLEARSHATMRLSHIKHCAQSERRTLPPPSNISAEQLKYRKAMSKTAETEWQQQLSKSLKPPQRKSRDVTQQRPPSLSATHPYNYAQLPTKITNPSPPNSTREMHERAIPLLVKPATSVSHKRDMSMSDSPPPWRQYTDPMWQTSSDPHFWSVNRTILRSDRLVDPGNAISPTWMIGLPFGGMTEMAHSYPQNEVVAPNTYSRDE